MGSTPAPRLALQDCSFAARLQTAVMNCRASKVLPRATIGQTLGASPAWKPGVSAQIQTTRSQIAAKVSRKRQHEGLRGVPGSNSICGGFPQSVIRSVGTKASHSSSWWREAWVIAIRDDEAGERNGQNGQNGLKQRRALWSLLSPQTYCSVGERWPQRRNKRVRREIYEVPQHEAPLSDRTTANQLR